MREFGGDDARSDGVHAHFVCGELCGEHFSHLEERRLRDAVRGEPGERLEAGDRRHEQDAAAAANTNTTDMCCEWSGVEWSGEQSVWSEPGLHNVRRDELSEEQATGHVRVQDL